MGIACSTSYNISISSKLSKKYWYYSLLNKLYPKYAPIQSFCLHCPMGIFWRVCHLLVQYLWFHMILAVSTEIFVYHQKYQFRFKVSSLNKNNLHKGLTKSTSFVVELHLLWIVDLLGCLFSWRGMCPISVEFTLEVSITSLDGNDSAESSQLS